MAKVKLHFTEDGAATVAGLLFIAAALVVFGLTRQALPSVSFEWKHTGDLASVCSPDNLLSLSVIFAVSYGIIAFGYVLQGKSLKDTPGYIIVFLVAAVALLAGGNRTMNQWGPESVIFSLSAGLLINHVSGIPEWLKKSLSSELYIKIGVILLGSTILLQHLLKSGILGLIQSVAVVFSVWYFSFWLCRRFKIDKEMSVMLSSAVSICGVSAAIASAGAIKGDPKKLLYVVSLVLIVAVPMILVMPPLARLLGFVLVSLLFSLCFAGGEYVPLAASLKKFQNLWFTMGFVSIGLETNFRALIGNENRKAALVFIGAQLFNVVFTLLAAYIVFGINY
ncbi:MAG: putative sulfate exporter family transporter [Tannerella sp.]|jgi:uncharacterized membrane protein YadS|nr:putative sulfate exporter family transporter [Tannerella sp.]